MTDHTYIIWLGVLSIANTMLTMFVFTLNAGHIRDLYERISELAKMISKLAGGTE